jgi:hypothetical protein
LGALVRIKRQLKSGRLLLLTPDDHYLLSLAKQTTLYV